jgi:predicted HicB family RNase H-like nuclease
MTKPNYDLSDDFVKGAEDRASEHKTKPSDSLVMLNARVPKELRDRLKFAAVTHSRSNGSIVIEALEKWLNEAESKEPKSTAFDNDGL